MVSSAGPIAHPTFQPVSEKVLPSEDSVRVRSHIPVTPGQPQVGTVEHHFLVDLVGDGDGVVLDAQPGDGV